MKNILLCSAMFLGTLGVMADETSTEANKTHCHSERGNNPKIDHQQQVDDKQIEEESAAAEG